MRESSVAKLVGLSLVYPAGDPETAAELGRLREALSQGVVLLIGGRAAESYRSAVGSDAVWVESLDEVQETLGTIAREAAGKTPTSG